VRSIGGPELLVIFLIALLLFGGGKVRDLGKGLGETLRHLRDATKEAEEVKQDLKS
jgi:sec-independent protein translocase protein TatA